ncbi:NAD(P)-dependent glycerol-3-phosphate dehydrogenase [Kineosporia sp. J2-2]|uniref:Glycerol-3-phosphate dehydrogenase [NAD(P)+] n=1 Tax=Kineosporia corallincola TaxID=2835133 RepID=A0ABS5TH97_9ACTN|nr:NAD(P)H-dependent glycerol-3-phosphate dehydrogenase [Kineosporia corallincola]MBT0769769.1 NAD(P)-dependent glycerol-3-phosphate dehydrogenase [Kineosporia corallincola]
MSRVAVMGTGSWGTTFAMVLADAGAEVTMWGRRAEVCADIALRHQNPDYLPGLDLPVSITATPDPAAALERADIVVLAVPSQTLRTNLAAWKPLIGPSAVTVSLMKGVEDGTLRRMSEVIGEVLEIGPERNVVVSGPNLAAEIAARQPTATVVACTDHASAELVAAACYAPYFRPYTNHDVIGVELSGAVKNAIALAVGMVEGMGLGDNSKASIITRGLAEITRLGVALGAEPATFAGLAGMGDLVATCASPLSRNRSFGVHLGRGMSVDEVIAITNRTAEGVKSAGPILDLARAHGVDMPITEAVTGVVRGELPLSELAQSLLSRRRKSEFA